MIGIKMAEIDFSKIAVSTGASLCAGMSLLLWFLLISDGHPSRLVLLRQRPYVSSQAVVGVLVWAGLLGSVALAVYQPVLRSDPSRPALTIELGFLLLLPPINEFLGLVNQRVRSIYYFIIFPISKTLLLLTFFLDHIQSRIRHILYASILLLTTAEILFFAIVYVWLWQICSRSNTSYPASFRPLGFFQNQPSKHQRALKAAALTTIVLWFFSGVITVSAYLEQFGETHLATTEIAMLSLMRLVIPYFLTKEI
ncbi:uncharacterized protein BDV17DRAFT_261736 [Aspergillus undulatus]|uniref:uncharacterized protein n=1 Tax=Aspergillus undulatus TaxID=1810928 RepID=UPI003CCD869A